MVVINNNCVFVNGKKTTDPTLIGLAILDALETGERRPIDKRERRNKIKAYIKEKQFRKTLERKHLTDIICSMIVFDSETLIERAEKKNISRASAYNFMVLLQEANIITKKEHLFI